MENWDNETREYRRTFGGTLPSSWTIIRLVNNFSERSTIARRHYHRDASVRIKFRSKSKSQTTDVLKDEIRRCIDEMSENNDDAGLMQHITSLLTISKTRFVGLRLLDKFIGNCSVDALEKKGDLWVSLVLKACSNPERHCASTPLIFRVLNKLIKSSKQAPDLAKSFTSTHISKAYDCLIKVPLSESKYTLNCIETCLRIYPGSTGSSRGIIERFLWKNLDHIDNDVVQNCGKCFHLLQQVKVGGVQGVDRKTQWKNYQLQLISGIHSMYNEMFANCTEMHEEKFEQNLPFATDQIDFDPDPVKKAAQMYTRCSNLVTYLIIALREPFPVEKPILIRKILNIVIRGLSMNCLMLERNPIADNIALSVLLPRLHIDLLNLFNIMVTILRGHLRPYSELILGVLLDALKWTSAKSIHEDKKTLLFLRERIYGTIVLWCRVFCSSNRCETISEHLFQEILSDITPTQSDLTLKTLNSTQKQMSKKARRELHNAQNEKARMSQTHSGMRDVKHKISEKRNLELCIAALHCLQEVLFSVANFVKPTILKMMQMSITKIAAKFNEHTRNSANLYDNKDCRIELYNTLYAILTTTHHLCPPPTELVLETIQTAHMCDDSVKIRIRCRFLLQELEKIIHPQKEGLMFPIELRDIRNTFIMLGQENLLREFEVNSLRSISNGNTIDNVAKKCGKEQDNIETQALSTSISENKEIQNKQTNSDMSDFESAVDQVNCVNNEALTRQKCVTNKTIDNLPKSPEFALRVDDMDIVAGNEEKEKNLNGRDIDEPLKKKRKVDDTETTYSDIIKNIDVNHDEEQILAEIASQFVDELE